MYLKPNYDRFTSLLLYPLQLYDAAIKNVSYSYFFLDLKFKIIALYFSFAHSYCPNSTLPWFHTHVSTAGAILMGDMGQGLAVSLSWHPWFPLLAQWVLPEPTVLRFISGLAPSLPSQVGTLMVMDLWDLPSLANLDSKCHIIDQVCQKSN